MISHRLPWRQAVGIGVASAALFVGLGISVVDLTHNAIFIRLMFALAFGGLAGTCFLHHKRIRYLERDPLTGCFQRYVAYKELDKIRKARSTVCVSIVDVNNLKVVNDTEGHEAGDAVIREVATRLMSRFGKRLKTGSMVARLGGDEFLIISSDCNPEVVGGDIESLLCMEYHGRFDVAVGGVAVALRGDWSDGLSRADAASYRAKELSRQSGKAVVVVA